MKLASQEAMTTCKPEQNSKFWIICLGFTFAAPLIAFFNDDLLQFLTPFVYPFLLIILAVIFIVVFFASLVFIPVKIKINSWKAFLPFSINGITVLVIIFLFLPLSKLRYEAEFLAKRKDYQDVLEWINTSMMSGDLVLEERVPKLVALPKKLQNLTPDGFVVIEIADGDICVLFPAIFQGMFEYSPSFLYRPLTNILRVY